MSPIKVRWGIIGTSFISDTMAQAIQESDCGEVTAILSRSADKGRQFAEKYDCAAVYADSVTFFRDENIDVVYIGLPNHMHKEAVIDCNNAGKHVLCEKPFTLTLEEARQAFNACEKAGVICMEALMYRYHPIVLKLEELIRQNTIGKINLITATYMADIAEMANKTAGGAIRNIGCYPLSLVRLLLGDEPMDVSAIGRVNRTDHSDNQACALLRFANESAAVISTADDMEKNWQFDIYGENGSISAISNPWMAEKGVSTLLLSRKGEKTEELTILAEKNTYVYQIDVMNQKILGELDQAVDVSKAHSLGNVAVIESWLEQVKESRVCYDPDIKAVS